MLHETLGDIWLGEGDQARNLTNSDAHETSPVWDPDHRDRVLRIVDRRGTRIGLRVAHAKRRARAADDTSPRNTEASRISSDGTRLAYVRGTGALAQGLLLSNETRFQLVVRESGREQVVTGITGRELQYANFAAKVPPSVMFGPDGQTIYFTEFADDVLVLKQIGIDGSDERTLYRFPHAVEAALSPDLQWIAIQEYHRSFLTPFQAAGRPSR